MRQPLRFMGVRIATGLLGILLVLSPPGAAANAAECSFSFLTYNVHGLFPLIAKDNPRDRSPTIGWLATKYDIVLLQEDFEYHDIIAAQIEHHSSFQGNGMGFDPRRVAVKIVLFPFQLLLPHFSPPYGAGITAFVDNEFSVDPDVTRKSYDQCYGWFGANGDCWARKGFLRVRVRTPEGVEIDVYNTHLEAGSSEESIAVRGGQLDDMAAAIETLSSGQGIIVAGDFNLDFRRPSDRRNLLDFRARLGLEDSGAGPELRFWRDRDYILYRDGPDTTFTVEAAGEAHEFTNRDRALSDHPALFARFHIMRNSADGPPQ